MAPNLNRLTTVSQQPSLRDYKPHRHTLSLSSILHPPLKESNPIVQPPSVQGGNDDIDGSFRIIFYDTLSEKVKELVFLAEGDFDSNILDILQPQKLQAEQALHSTDISTKAVTSAHDSDPLLCEAVLRSVYAQGTLQLSLQERQDLAENVKRAFSLSEAAFREAKTRAIKATWHRRAEVQDQLDDLLEDKGGLLNPNHFESFSFYEECKAQEMMELANVYTTLQALPSVSAQVEVGILSAEDISNNTQCVKRRMCYGTSRDLQVYCTVKVVPASQTMDDDDGKNPDYVTKVAGFTEHVQWHDKSPFILLSSVDDSICVTMWKKKVPATSPSKGSEKDLKVGSPLRNISQKEEKRARNGDICLGQVHLPMKNIETRTLSIGNIRGRFSSKSHHLRNAKKDKVMISLELQISFSCEILLNNSSHDKMLFQLPLADVEAGYSALVQVAYGMHLEGELQLEDTWQKILSCYEAYYRLRRETCCLVILKHLAASFQPELEYLEFMSNKLKPLCKSAKEGKLRKSEYSLLAEVIEVMIRPSLSVIEDFQSVLLGESKGVISKLIEVLSLLLCWDPSPMEAKACLKRWVKTSCVQRFNKHLKESSSDGDMTPRAFSTAISFLRKDLTSLCTCFKKESPEELGLFETCALEYYGLVSQYITEIVGSVKISSMDLEDVARELVLLHQELERCNMKMEFLDLHGLLRDHIIEMITAVKPRMINWIVCSLNEEKWQPISHATDALFSHSVVDLYFMVNGVVENLTTRLSCFPFGKHYYVNLEESVCSAVESYIQMTERMCLQELPSKFDEEHHHIMNHFKLFHNSKSLCITKSLCVKLNNLHSVQQQQLSLEENLARKLESYMQPFSADLGELDIFEDNNRKFEKIDVEDTAQMKTFGQRFANLHNLVKLALSNVTGSIIAEMQNELEGRLQKLMITCSMDGKKILVMEDLEVLTNYFDGHLKALNEWLDPNVFKNLLLEIAAALVFCMEEFALNRDEDPSPMTVQQRDYMEQIVNLFYSYFYGDGVGISNSEMDHISKRLRKILECSDLNTHELCVLYWKAWDRFNKEATPNPCSVNEQEIQVLDFLLLLQQRNDEEAQIIVTNQKLLAKEQMMQIPDLKEREFLPKLKVESPRDMVRGLAQYLRENRTPLLPLNVSYSAFQRMKRW